MHRVEQMTGGAATSPADASPDLAAFRAEVRSWLVTVAVERSRIDWGKGSDSVALFDNLTEQEEKASVEDRRGWTRRRFDAGYGAIDLAERWGGRALTDAHAWVYRDEERHFAVPPSSELFDVTVALIAPTIIAWGTDEQRERYVRPLVRSDLLACQLFSEPDAGSDLAGVTTGATRDGSSWVLSGQKVWTSGAAVADLGLAICRSDRTGRRNHNLTAFLVPLNAPGVTIRRLRQMSGGSCFAEVFLDDVRLEDSMRLGPVGEGWQVALTTLAAERLTAGELGADAPGRLVALHEHLGRPRRAQAAVVDVWAHHLVQRMMVERVVEGIANGREPVLGSLLKLSATRNMRRVSDAASLLLGPRLVADIGEWGTYAWSEQVLGAPGYRIAGGSDEVQRNIVAERLLGLPREPRYAETVAARPAATGAPHPSG